MLFNEKNCGTSGLDSGRLQSHVNFYYSDCSKIKLFGSRKCNAVTTTFNFWSLPEAKPEVLQFFSLNNICFCAHLTTFLSFCVFFSNKGKALKKGVFEKQIFTNTLYRYLPATHREGKELPTKCLWPWSKDWHLFCFPEVKRRIFLFAWL